MSITHPGRPSCPRGDSCPGCGAAKLLPRSHWFDVMWCYGCGGQFDAYSLRPIHPIDGPIAIRDRYTKGSEEQKQ